MPRVNSTEFKPEYVKTDFRHYVFDEMKDRKISQREMAFHLGITQQRLSQKLQTGDFSIGEMAIIFEVLNTPPETIATIFIGRKIKCWNYG